MQVLKNKEQLKNVASSLGNNAKKFWQSPEKVFIVLALAFGLVMVFLLPLFRAPDEMAHFFRAYQVGEGQFFSQTTSDGRTGGIVPPLIEGHYFEKASNQFAEFPSSALYSPVSYIPQAIGIDIGKLIHPSVGVMVLVGRLFNLLAYVALVAIAIRIARQGRWVYVVAGLFPMAIHQAASLSSDVLTIGLSFIVIASTHRLFIQKSVITKKQYIAALVLAFCVGLTKQTNIIFLLPLLFLPKNIFSTLWHRIGFTISVGLVALSAFVLWYFALRYLNYDLNFATAAGVDQIGQLKHIIEQPFSFVEVLVRTYLIEGIGGTATSDFFLVSMVGFFSWITYKLPLLCILFSYILLFMAFLYREKSEPALNSRSVWSSTTTFIVSLIAIAGALYLAWTPVGAAQVSGIQGRYFIGLVPLLIPLFILLSRWIKVSFDSPYRMGTIVTIVSGVNLAVMLTLTYVWFY